MGKHGQEAHEVEVGGDEMGSIGTSHTRSGLKLALYAAVNSGCVLQTRGGVSVARCRGRGHPGPIRQRGDHGSSGSSMRSRLNYSYFHYLPRCKYFVPNLRTLHGFDISYRYAGSCIM